LIYFNDYCFPGPVEDGSSVGMIIGICVAVVFVGVLPVVLAFIIIRRRRRNT